MQSGYDINHLAREAHTRWLKAVEVYFILKNCEEHQLTHQVPQNPTSGSLYLFNKRVLKFFRKDGHRWRRRRDQRTIAEAHERLKVGNVEALNCYYAHGEVNPNFQRRSYWILEAQYEHIVLVHYRDVGEGRQMARSTSESPPLSSSTFSPSPNSFATQQPASSFAVAGSYEMYYNESSPSSVEISSSEVQTDLGRNQLNFIDKSNEANSSSAPYFNEALKRLEQQLSLNEDEVVEYNPLYPENEDSNSFNAFMCGEASNASDSLHTQQFSGDRILQRQHAGVNIEIWEDMPNIESQARVGVHEPQNSSLHPAFFTPSSTYGINQDSFSSLFDHTDLVNPVENNISLTISQKQKFTIREISPDWCYTSEGAKIVIVGSFLCNASDSSWACMFGDTEVPAKIIQDGVLCCHAPPHLQGKVTICITSGSKESCSEIRDFEYRAKHEVCTHRNSPEHQTDKSSEELLLLVRFVQMLIKSELKVGSFGISEGSEDPWNQIMDGLLFGSATSSSTLDWLLQELLRDKLQLWLSSRLVDNNQKGCFLPKEEQGIIHMVAGLGFEWALQPILSTGVSVNFRDLNGWTALHWASRFGREKMVAALIASGASAGAVTDPNSQDPNGKTPASIASTCGHKGLAGYLSEVALTSHLSSLVLEESELSKGSAAIEAERTVNSISSTNEDQVSLKDTLSAVRNAAQAAARIQSAFRAHSFRRRQQREAGDSEDEYGIPSNDIHRISAASKLAFGISRGDHNTSALSIQKNYKSWKGRKEFLTLRQKVVKIQAHVRGYQVRKNYRFCWAVGILEKVVLRWRRRGVGLRGFRHDSELIDQNDDEDILKVFRKQKVDAAIDEAVSTVLSMVESPDARQQYHRLLEKYRLAKMGLQVFQGQREQAESDMSSSNQSGTSYMEK